MLLKSLGLLLLASQKCELFLHTVIVPVPTATCDSTQSPLTAPKCSNVKELISILNQLRSLLIESAQLNRKPGRLFTHALLLLFLLSRPPHMTLLYSVHRRLEDISSDPKADPGALELAVKNDEQCASMVTKCLVGAYKTRALDIVANTT